MSFFNEELWQVITVSLLVSLYATLAALLCALGLAWLLVFKKSPFFKLLELLVYLPMALPPVALGYGLLLIFSPLSPAGRFLGSLGIEVAFSFLGAVVAAFFVSLGIGLRTLRVALEEIDLQQCQIAELMGATKIQVFWFVILPQCKRALLGACVLVFIRAFSEFGATMVLAGNLLGKTRTLALAIWVDMETPGKEQQCFVLVMVALFISLLALVVAEVILPRKKI